MPVDTDARPAFVDRAGVPVLEDAIAWVATRAGAAVDAGDHTLFMGEVVDLRPERPDEPALAFHCSAFARVVPSDGPQIPLPFGEWENEVGWWA
jgi:flavin reductase (DIM6/NTAB) family NADH-FMN oxidoreductase RutF